MSLAPGAAFGKYVVKRQLAEGGMAEIYLCTSRGVEGFQKEVVVKRVKPFLASDPEFVRMFIAEARLASQLNHPNIVQIFDFDQVDGTYYLAMEYVRGPSLWQVALRARSLQRPIPPVVVAYLGRELARGLHYAHSLTDDGHPVGLVHRDVSPHNVLVSFEGAVKLTDFGIAKAGRHSTAPGVLKGKLGYMSPEQAHGEPLDARSDLFSLGVVLWELLTDAPLFDATSDVSMLRAVIEAPIVPPSARRAGLPPELDAIVTRALARPVEQRWQSAQELERALTRYLAQDPAGASVDLPEFLRQLELPTELPVFAAGSPRAQAFAPEGGSAAAGQGGVDLGSERTIQRATPHSFLQSESTSSTPALRAPQGHVVAVPSAPARAAPGLASSVSVEPRASFESGPAPASATRAVALGGAALLAVLGAAIGWQVMSRTTPAQPLAPVPASQPLVAPPLHASTEVDALRPARTPEPPDAGGAPVVVAGAPHLEARSEATPGTSTAGARPAEKSSVPARAGSLLVDVTPWAEVKIDGKSRGEVVGKKTFPVSAGPHRVELVHPSKSESFEVLVSPGKVHRVALSVSAGL